MATDGRSVSLSSTLIFVRHGETDWNVERRLQGQQDIPLNQGGRRQAQRNGRILGAIDGIGGFDFVASPLGRAIETMRILRAQLGLDPNEFRTNHGLIEITFGGWEGFTLAELAVERSEDVRRRQADKWHFVPPRGESYQMLEPRVRNWLEAVAGDTVAVSHGAVARVVQGLLFGVEPHRVPSLPSPQDRVLIWRDGAGHWL